LANSPHDRQRLPAKRGLCTDFNRMCRTGGSGADERRRLAILSRIHVYAASRIIVATAERATKS
jgi:hypothetical protein